MSDETPKKTVDAKVFYVSKAAAEVGPASAADPWLNTKDYDDTLIAPYSKFALAQIADEHGYTRGILDALQDNTAAFGGRLVSAAKVKEDSEDAQDAYFRALNFIENIGVNGESLTSIRRKLAADLFRTGEAYLEVLVNKRGRPVAVKQIPSHQFRITLESEPVRVTRTVVKYSPSGPSLDTRYEQPRFRRFCQRMTDGTTRWFKEWGDPRDIDAQTGKVLDDPKGRPLATPVIRFFNYSSWTPYGVPAWVAALVETKGASGVSRLNLGMTENNAIPAMAILISGGRATQGSLDRIKDFLESRGKSRESLASVLLLEAESELESDPGNAKIEIKPLTSDQRDDSLFGKYLDHCDEQISAATRVPPMFAGKGQANEELRRLADEQVFAPCRSDFDAIFNAQLLILHSRGLWTYESRGPNITSSAVSANILATLERTGGINPAIARRVAEEIFPAAAEGAEWDESLNRSKPFSLTLVENAKKDNTGKTTQADKMPGEPGHIVAPAVPAVSPGADGKQKP